MNASIFYSVCIPVLNEGGNLAVLVPKLDDVLKSTAKPYEILILNDRGTDNSEIVLENLKKEFSDLHVIDRNSNPGPGYALREGFKRAQGEIIITMDGDLSHDPSDIPYLLEGLHEADMVCGSRYIKGGEGRLGWVRQIFSKIFNWLVQQCTGVPIQHATSNFRVFRRKIIETIVLDGGQFGIFIEIPIQTYRAGFPMTERPIHYCVRGTGRSHSSPRQWLDYVKTLFKYCARR